MKALKVLKKGDIVEVKGMAKPPPAVVLTMQAICVMMSVAPIMVKNPSGVFLKIAFEYWFFELCFDFSVDNVCNRRAQIPQTCGSCPGHGEATAFCGAHDVLSCTLYSNSVIQKKQKKNCRTGNQIRFD